MSKQARVEIIAIGNELLIGDVPDTNTNWLCKRITGLGGHMTRAAMIRDDTGDIVDEIRSSLERRPDLIITTGGLGPTGDDITLQAVAEALARPLELHPKALALVKSRYKNLAEMGYIKDSALTDARKKMAYLPKDATAVANPVGTAPASVLKVGASTLVSLPGVPEEMKGIFEETLPPTLQPIFDDSYYQERAIIAHCGDESTLAPILSEVVDAHPEVYIKSRARRYGPEVRILLTLSSAGDTKDEVERAIQSALDALIGVLATAGFEVEQEAAE